MINIGVHLIACSNRIEIYQQIIPTLVLSWVSLTSLFASRNKRGWADGHSPRKAAHKQPRVATLWTAGVAKKEGKEGKLTSSYSKCGSEAWVYLGAC